MLHKAFPREPIRLESTKVHVNPPEKTRPDQHFWACLHLHDQMPSALQLRHWVAHSLNPASRGRALAPQASSPLPLANRWADGVTKCVGGCGNLLPACGEEDAHRWPIYRLDLDADVTQQSGTVCAAALMGFMEQQLTTAESPLTSAKTGSV